MGVVTEVHRRGGHELFRYAYDSGLLPPPAPAPAAGMWRYRDLLPLPDGPVRYPLPVGGTPLLPAPLLRAQLGMARLWLKDETRGPSASNKDRAAALVVEDGLRHGVDTVTTASTGNAAVATALAAAAGGLRSVIFVPLRCPAEKVSLMRAVGAQVFRVPEGYDAAIGLSRAAARRFGWLDRNTGLNPMTTEAKKTVAFEIWEQLDRRMPDAVVAPVGDGVTLVALAKGFDEVRACGGGDRVPRLIGVQAEGCQPLARAWAAGRDWPPASGGEPDYPDDAPDATMADGIAVDRPVMGALALAAIRETAGTLLPVPDSALAEAVGMLARRAGLFSEPAGAAGLAALRVALATGRVRPPESVVVLVTGGGRGAAPPPDGGGAAVVVDDLDQVAVHLTLPG